MSIFHGCYFHVLLETKSDRIRICFLIVKTQNPKLQPVQCYFGVHVRSHCRREVYCRPTMALLPAVDGITLDRVKPTRVVVAYWRHINTREDSGRESSETRTG